MYSHFATWLSGMSLMRSWFSWDRPSSMENVYLTRLSSVSIFKRSLLIPAVHWQGALATQDQWKTHQMFQMVSLSHATRFSGAIIQILIPANAIPIPTVLSDAFASALVLETKSAIVRHSLFRTLYKTFPGEKHVTSLHSNTSSGHVWGHFLC